MDFVLTVTVTGNKAVYQVDKDVPAAMVLKTLEAIRELVVRDAVNAAVVSPKKEEPDVER